MIEKKWKHGYDREHAMESSLERKQDTRFLVPNENGSLTEVGPIRKKLYYTAMNLSHSLKWLEIYSNQYESLNLSHPRLTEKNANHSNYFSINQPQILAQCFLQLLEEYRELPLLHLAKPCFQQIFYKVCSFFFMISGLCSWFVFLFLFFINVLLSHFIWFNLVLRVIKIVYLGYEDNLFTCMDSIK